MSEQETIKSLVDFFHAIDALLLDRLSYVSASYARRGKTGRTMTKEEVRLFTRNCLELHTLGTMLAQVSQTMAGKTLMAATAISELELTRWQVEDHKKVGTMIDGLQKILDLAKEED